MSHTDTAQAEALAPPGCEMTIVHAQALHSWLAQAVQEAISRGDGLVNVDLGEVCEVDSCGLQLLLSARKTLQRHNGSLHVGKASEVVRESLGRFGFGVASDGALCLSFQPTGAQA
jgi:anti-anti-sigma regulatory factor